MTEQQQRVEKYGRPTEEDYWISRMKWDHAPDMAPTMHCRFFRVPK